MFASGSAYVVYDLENNQVAIAETAFNATDTQIEEIGSNVPEAKTIVGPTVQQTATDIRFGETGVVTATGRGGAVVTAGSRTPTFNLGGSTKTNGASSSIRPPPFEVAWLITCGIAGLAFLFGGSMFFYK